jgi:hypothetical protein
MMAQGKGRAGATQGIDGVELVVRVVGEDEDVRHSDARIAARAAFAFCDTFSARFFMVFRWPVPMVAVPSPYAARRSAA